MQTYSKFEQDFEKIPDQTPYTYVRSILNTEVTKNGLCKRFIHGKCLLEKCQFSHDSTKMKPCHHYQNNSCTKGDDCDFSHIKDNRTICKFFIRNGACSNGESCQFKHVLKPCRNYDKGFCEFGRKCEYTHVPKKVCMNYLYGFCPEGPDCPNAHPKLFIDWDKEFLETFERTKGTLEKGKTIIRCNECQEIGHKKTNCYFLKELPAIIEIYCTKCKKKHKSDECPLVK